MGAALRGRPRVVEKDYEYPTGAATEARPYTRVMHPRTTSLSKLTTALIISLIRIIAMSDTVCGNVEKTD